MNPNDRLMCCLMSIRGDYTPDIFETRVKFFEWRSWFEPKFTGRVYVYESGTDSQHKVVGFFDTAKVIRIYPNKKLAPSVYKLAEQLPVDVADELLEAPFDMAPDEKLFAIPILKPKRFLHPVSLRDFSNFYRTSPYFDKPPRSWQMFARPKSVCELENMPPMADLAKPSTNKTPTEMQLDMFNKGGHSDP